MLNRRAAVTGALCSCALLPTTRISAATTVKRIVFIHGRSQAGETADTVRRAWSEALGKGAALGGLTPPSSSPIEIAPFYGDLLDKFAADFELPLSADVKLRGNKVESEFIAFQAEVAEEVRQKLGVTDEQIDREYGPDTKIRGPLNWGWVQAILRAIDKYGGSTSQAALELITRDVFLYTTRPGVQSAIDEIVAKAFTDEPCLVVGHSLGSIVAYNVLRNERRNISVPLLVTIGSPLGIRPIRNQLRPLRHPAPVKAWYNAYDRRDGIALYPLDATNFPVRPPIDNDPSIKNETDNHHGAIGYLGTSAVAKRIFGAL